jgi:cysteinyl-tRNA synthetase
MLQTHYRQPMNWTLAGLREAQKNLDHWYALTSELSSGGLCAHAVDALRDDLNTPKAFAALHELRGEAAKGAKAAGASLKATAQLIGLLQMSQVQWSSFRPASATVDENEVVSLIAARDSARQAKNFKEADRIRDELRTMGIELEDTKDGKTKWKVAR